MNISEHITLKEATKSELAIRRNLQNTPNEQQLENMRIVANEVFEPLRKFFNVPIGISSFFRSVEVNKAIGGSSTSQHCTGEAIDIDADIYGNLKNIDIFMFIKNNLEFDQLIWEFGNDFEPDWVHVSFSAKKNRKQILRASKFNGKTVYSKAS